MKIVLAGAGAFGAKHLDAIKVIGGIEVVSLVGRTLEGLVEGPSRTDPSRLRGRSRHNKVVNFDGLAAPGDITRVQITHATSQTLAGHELIAARAIV